jgi:hypothetical protein
LDSGIKIIFLGIFVKNIFKRVKIKKLHLIFRREKRKSFGATCRPSPIKHFTLWPKGISCRNGDKWHRSAGAVARRSSPKKKQKQKEKKTPSEWIAFVSLHHLARGAVHLLPFSFARRFLSH